MEKSQFFVVCEGEHFVSFLAKKMEVYGHTVVVPKIHVSNIFELDDETLKSLFSGVKMTAEHLQKSLGCDGVNLLHASGEYAQQTVKHLHIHLLPRFKDDGVDTWPDLPGTDATHQDIFKKLKQN